MKILIVLPVYGTHTLAWAQKSQRQLAAVSEQAGMEYETLLAGSDDLLSSTQNYDFLGKVYLQAWESIAPSAISEALAFSLGHAFDVIVFAEDSVSSDLSALLAAKLGYCFVSNVNRFWKESGKLCCSRLSYNNNVEVRYSLDTMFVISLRNLSGQVELQASTNVEFVRLPEVATPEYIKKQTLVESADEKAQSRVLIAAGMGVKSREHVDYLRKFAREHGFSFGVSRPVAMRGWGDINEIIGVSGSCYSPELCVCIGVSGAAAFMVGIEQSSYILSINTNSEVPIAAQSDSLICDNYENLLEDLCFFLERNFKDV